MSTAPTIVIESDPVEPIEPRLCKHLAAAPTATEYIGLVDKDGTPQLYCPSCAANRLYSLTSRNVTPHEATHTLYLDELTPSGMRHLLYSVLKSFRHTVKKHALSSANHVGYRNPKPSDVIHRPVYATGTR